MNKKVITILLITVFLASGLLLAATVNLKFLHRWTQEPDRSFFEEVVKEYEALNPNVKIDIQTVSNDAFKEKIKVMLGTAEAPDVFFTWPGEFTNRFIRAGNVLDITPYMLEDGSMFHYYGSQLIPFVYEGALYGLPYRLDGKVFVYNKEIFAQAGIDSAPQTLDEFMEDLEKLAALGMKPIAFGNERPWAVSHYIAALNQKSVPEEIWEIDTDPAIGTWTDPGYVKALEIYEDLVPYFNNFTNALKHDQARVAFMQGQHAMMYLEIVEIPEIERDGPAGFIDKIGVFPFPATDGPGNQSYLVGYPEGFVVSSKTKHPEEAVDFLKFLTGKEMGRLELEMLGWFNGIKNLVSPDEVKPIVFETTQLILDSEKMVNWLDSSLHAKIWSVYSVELQKLTDLVTTPQKAMDAVIKIATEVRSEF
ncbi:MAG TPA: ABC transporter substrate-binding protein [Thermotogota bacterium]|nr:ABC transporter substrate-binding protein [Thermotogota bacterium]HRW92811.1 ABC transporter substrate-binding protein [Thermotogota bacterium]